MKSNTPMTPEERVEAFKRELGLILRQILGLDPEAQDLLPKVDDETSLTNAEQT